MLYRSLVAVCALLANGVGAAPVHHDSAYHAITGKVHEESTFAISCEIYSAKVAAKEYKEKVLKTVTEGHVHAEQAGITYNNPHFSRCGACDSCASRTKCACSAGPCAADPHIPAKSGHYCWSPLNDGEANDPAEVGYMKCADLSCNSD